MEELGLRGRWIIWAKVTVLAIKTRCVHGKNELLWEYSVWELIPGLSVTDDSRWVIYKQEMLSFLFLKLVNSPLFKVQNKRSVNKMSQKLFWDQTDSDWIIFWNMK